MKPTFLTLIQMFQLEGMVALGKMLNPATNEITRNLEHARYVIDILEVLKEKTHGNLSDDEQRFLDHSLSTLRLNFVEETNRPSAPPPAEVAEGDGGNSSMFGDVRRSAGTTTGDVA